MTLADGRDVFVHESAVVGSKGGLRRGDKVSLLLVLKDKGWAGTKVELLARAPSKCFEPPDAVKGDLSI